MVLELSDSWLARRLTALNLIAKSNLPLLQLMDENPAWLHDPKCKIDHHILKGCGIRSHAGSCPSTVTKSFSRILNTGAQKSMSSVECLLLVIWSPKPKLLVCP